MAAYQTMGRLMGALNTRAEAIYGVARRHLGATGWPCAATAFATNPCLRMLTASRFISACKVCEEYVWSREEGGEE